MNRKIVLISLFVAAAIIAGFILIGRGKNPDQSSLAPQEETINYAPATEEEKNEAENSKINLSNPNNDNKTDKEAIIAELYQDDQSKKIVVKTRLEGIGWKSCTISLTNNQKSFTVNSEVIYQQNYSTCAGFSFEPSDFPASGKWNVSLEAINKDGMTYKSGVETVNVSK